MSYFIKSFDGLDLPTARPTHFVGTDGSRARMLPVAGGRWFDTQGSDRSMPELRPIRLRNLLTAASASALQTAYDALKAKAHKRGTLSAVLSSGGTITRTAVLEYIDSDHESGQITWMPVEMVFMPVSPGWDGTARSVDGTITASPGTITVANSGNRRVTDAIITLSAVGTNITNASIHVDTVSQIVYAGTITAGQSLVIDCGAMTVKNNGADAYSGFSLNADSHHVDDWLRLESGNNSVVVTLTGGGTVSTVNFAFNDGWY